MSKYRQITISNTRVTEIHSISGIICDTHDGTFSPAAAKRGNAPTTVGKWQCQLPSPVGKKRKCEIGNLGCSRDTLLNM